MKTDRTYSISRRGFLKTLAALGGFLVPGLVGNVSASDSIQRILNINSSQSLMEGCLVRLPGHGKLYVASDFHSRYSEFQKWLDRTSILERIRYGEDVYGLILGDAVDMKPGDSLAEEYGDRRIVDRIMEFQNNPAVPGDRLIFISGNHEDRCVSIYRSLQREEDMTPANQLSRIKELFDSQNGDYFRQFNFLCRMDDEICNYLSGLPLAVISSSGILGVHAGPSVSMLSMKEIVSRRESVAQELLWSRPIEVRKDGYDTEDLTTFLKISDNASILVSGHTPLSYLPEDMVRNDIGDYGEHQVILATSYGSDPYRRSYLCLDLKNRYSGTSQLLFGEEILTLEESESTHSRDDLILAESNIDHC